MGGRPQTSQVPLLRLCTHTILLLREDLPDEAERWQRLVENYNLLPLARLFSRQSGDATITALSPVLELATVVGRCRPGRAANPNLDHRRNRRAPEILEDFS